MTEKRVVILQSNYIPWKGYFDLMASADEFIIYDDMQFTRRDWRNRNKIKTPQGDQWITIPVKNKGRFDQTIRETQIDGDDWIAKHLRSLETNYHRASHFDEIMPMLHPIYVSGYTHISELNRAFIDVVVGYLGINTKISNCWDYGIVDGKTERLLDLCQKAGATTYISGPAAKDYLDEGLFRESGINVEWFDYRGYPEYPQLWGAFSHGVSVVDLMFNCGGSAREMFRGDWRYGHLASAA